MSRSPRRACSAAGLRLAGWLLAGGAATAAALPLQAQTPADSGTRRDSIVRLAVTRVTVLRTPFELRRAPYAIAVLGASELQRARPGLNLAESLVAVPGVQVDNRYNYALGERISVRGAGARSQFGVRGVRVIVDGIPATMPDGQTSLNHVDVATLGRAEIIRGPASALYGNASGGVIQLESEGPPAGVIAERARLTIGSAGLARVQSTTGGQLALGQTPAGYTVNLSGLRYDGFRGWSDASSRYAAVTGRVDGERTRAALALHAVDYDAHNPGGLSDSLRRVDRDQPFRDNAVRWRAGESGRHLQLGGSVARELTRLGELRLSAWTLGRDIENPIPQRVVVLDRRASGVRLAHASRGALFGREVQGVVAVEREMQRDDRQNFVNDSGRRAARRLDQQERVTATAGVAQGSVALFRALDLVAAVRHDVFRFAVDDRYVEGGDPDDSGVRRMRATSPSLGATVRVGRGSLYANVATAFETPTTTELGNRPDGAGGFNPELGPQRTRSAELGAQLPVGSRAGLQLALYRSRVRDALVPFEVESFPGRQFFRNAGSTDNRGAEAGVTAALRALTVRAAYTYTDARFDRYRIGSATFDGNRVPGIAPHRADVVLGVTRPNVGVLEVEERWQSATPTNDANRAGSASGGYALTNLRLRVDERRLGPVGIAPSGGVTNLFGRRYDSSVTVNAFGGRYFEPGPGIGGYVGLELTAARR